MNKKLKSSLTLKIFLSTLAMLFVACCISVFALAKYIPETYTQQLSENLQLRAETLLQKLEDSKNIEECYAFTDLFSAKTGAQVSILDETGNVIHVSEDKRVDPHIVLSEFAKTLGKSTEFERNHVAQHREKREEYAKDSVVVMQDGDFFAQTVESSLLSKLIFPFFIQNSNQQFILEIQGTSMPVNQAVSAIWDTLPVILGGIFILSLLCALFYSHFITKPILTLSEVSKRMAGLDFSVKHRCKRTDEVGELSRNLNSLSYNLEKTLHELQCEIIREKELEKKQRQFFASASHDLKTPIAILSGHLNGILDGVGDYKDAEKYIRRSVVITEQMHQLVQSLLWISQMENDAVTPNFEKSDLSELTRRAVADIAYLIEKKEQHISVSIPDHAQCWFDSMMMERIVRNLLENAVRHSPENADIIISIVQTLPGTVSFSVENTGIFLSEDCLWHMFEPFYRAELSRNREKGGNGLGLYIVKTLLDVHGGSYGIENTDSGVKAWFQLQAEKA